MTLKTNCVLFKGELGEAGRSGIPGVQGGEGEPGIYDPTLDQITIGAEGPQGPIGKLTPYFSFILSSITILQLKNIEEFKKKMCSFTHRSKHKTKL